MPKAQLALFRLSEGSNKQTRKEIRPDESSRHDGRLSSKSQKCVPPRGHAQLESSTKPVRTPENPRLSQIGRLVGGSLVSLGWFGQLLPQWAAISTLQLL